jgi:hypothetical protein
MRKRLLLVGIMSSTLFAGDLEGVIHLKTSVPKKKVIQMAADPICVQKNKGKKIFFEDVVVSDRNTLANVFVYLKEGVTRQNAGPDKTQPVVLDQRGCVYIPHVWGVRVNQPFTILNSDPTLHNVHSLAKINTNFNVGMATPGQKTEKIFSKAEVMIRIKCDVHGWMNTYVGVLDHSFFQVTGLDGRFLLGNVPEGEYTIAAWHEKFGEQTQKISISKNTPSPPLTFSF